MDARLIRVSHSMQTAERSGRMYIAATKTRSSIHTVPILDALYDVLASLPHDDEFAILPHYTASATKEHAIDSFNHYMQTHYDETFKIQSYDPRHTYASQCYRANVDIKTAQSILGHATATMTMNVYTHISEERSKMSIDSLNNVFSGK